MISNCFSLSGKKALVTGSTRGLGAAIAVALAEAGADVAVHGRSNNGETTCHLIHTLGRKTCFFQGDLADAQTGSELVRKTILELGALDILINNAGMIRRAPAVDYADQDWEQLIAANLSSVFRLSKLAARHMLDRGSGGKIVNIASLLSFQGGILVPAYAAAKGGVAQLTKAFANEWARFGINVNAIAPGYMETDNTEALRKDPDRSRQIMERIPASRWGTAQDVGGAAVFLCSSAASYVHGHVLVVDGGWMSR